MTRGEQKRRKKSAGRASGGKTVRKAPSAHKTAAARDQVFEGLGVSPGIAIGEAYVRESGHIQVAEYLVPTTKLKAEVERFQGAVAKARRQLGKLQVKAESLHGAAAEELGYLLDAHAQMLASSRLLEGVVRRITEDRLNAEAAVMAEITGIAASFEAMDDPYLRTRGDEIREVGLRVVRNLSDKEFHGFGDLRPDSIVIAEEITPADTALMDPRHVAGFATVLGGAESHTAIMARSLGIPAVLGVAGLMNGLRSGDSVIIDGSNGLIIVNPPADKVQHYQARRQALARELRALSRLRDVAAVTRDGERICLQANLELPREVGQAVAAGAEGVGLLRTEFLFMNREDLPDEEEQYQALREVIEGMGGRPVTARTLDIGGEKLSIALGGAVAQAANPALGMRAIRLSLKERHLLEIQLAAMLRAAAHGPLRILLPMITSVSEVVEVRKMMQAVARRLKRRGVKLPDPLPPLGAMIEVPGAALSADALAKSADFFALGTNDLTMYTLAIDRAEEGVAHLYNPLHPAVLRLIQFSVEAALRARIPVSVCDEMAGDPRFTALFLGLGVRDLSMSANALLRVKSHILNTDLQSAMRRAAVIMDQVDIGRIAVLLDDFNSFT
ncbi:MAG: phosphoenolpyruvate--protein phosphotransferase [Kiloniellales bacterium]